MQFAIKSDCVASGRSSVLDILDNAAVANTLEDGGRLTRLTLLKIWMSILQLHHHRLSRLTNNAHWLKHCVENIVPRLPPALIA
jgi:hypothetical protein